MRFSRASAVTVPTTPAGTPGQTGRTVPGYTRTGPTVPSPYVRPDGRVSGEAYGRADTTRADTTIRGEAAPPAGPAPAPAGGQTPTPETHQ